MNAYVKQFYVIEHRTLRREVLRMKQAHDESKTIKKARIQLGKMIHRLSDKRGFSLRKSARQVDIPPSNLKYIEDGVNAPTSEYS